MSTGTITCGRFVSCSRRYRSGIDGCLDTEHCGAGRSVTQRALPRRVGGSVGPHRPRHPPARGGVGRRLGSARSRDAALRCDDLPDLRACPSRPDRRHSHRAGRRDPPRVEDTGEHRCDRVASIRPGHIRDRTRAVHDPGIESDDRYLLARAVGRRRVPAARRGRIRTGTRRVAGVAAPRRQTGPADRDRVPAAPGEVPSTAGIGDAGVSSGDAVFRRIQAVARSTAAKSGSGAPTQEYLIRHTLESFLDRLTRTSHAGDFVLKGGVLLAAYGVRRPTKDADANAVRARVTAEQLAQVVRDIAAIDVDDGVVFDLDTVSVQEIREQADHPGLRVRVAVSIGPWKGAAAWDVSTGDPIVPPPRQVTFDRILGDPITLLGYTPETTIAEKGVTILERGIASTRWRDYVDIVQLARRGIKPDELLRSARAVARHRGITLEPVAPHLAGYGAVGQAKWAAWRRKEHLESACEENLDDQTTLVAAYLEPVFAHGPG